MFVERSRNEQSCHYWFYGQQLFYPDVKNSMDQTSLACFNNWLLQSAFTIVRFINHIGIRLSFVDGSIYVASKYFIRTVCYYKYECTFAA
jgi:hypothetical protein